MATDNKYFQVEDSVELKVAHRGSDETVVVRKTRTPFMIIIGLLLFFLIIVTVIAVVFITLYATPSSSSSDVCQSEACFDLSVQMLGAMDESADPCEDFYNYTCGNWDVFNGFKTSMAGYNKLTQQKLKVYEELADVIEDDFTDGNEILIELQDLYDSCITAQEMNISASLVPAIGKFYHDLGGWSLVNIPGDGTVWGINSTQFIREKRLGSPAFYSLSIEPDYIFGIEQSGLTLGYPYYYSESGRRDMLVETIVTILQELAQPPVPVDEIRGAAVDIVDFETDLSQIWESIDYFSDGPNVTYTVDDLYVLWPTHDWLTVLMGVFKPSGVDIKRSSEFYVATPDYLMSLNSLVQATPTNTLENYAKWQVTWHLSQIFLSDSTIQYSIRALKEAAMGEPSMGERRECVKLVEKIMPIALGRVYADKILPSGYKEKVMELVSEVREGLRQRMMEVDWLDSETRQLAIEKLEAIESRVAYPEKTFDDNYLTELYGEYEFSETGYVGNFLQYIIISYQQSLSLSVDRNQWFPPTAVNAYYSGRFNQISILEGIIRAPFFSTEWPLSIQYGALGVILGHELTHGFDSNGRRYDKDGHRRMWWSKGAVQAFKDEARCFVEQYSNYSLFGLHLDGNTTLGENIADNGGLSASYDAYKRVTSKSKSLPGLTDYTDDQLFFIAFGQLWCAYVTPLSFKDSVRGVHSPEPFRVIGTLSNSEDFAEAFECPVGSPMNPRDKCLLW